MKPTTYIHQVFLVCLSVIFTDPSFAQSNVYKIKYECIRSTTQPLKGEDSILFMANGVSAMLRLKMPDSILVQQHFMICEAKGDSQNASLKQYLSFKQWNDLSNLKPLKMIYRDRQWYHEVGGSEKMIPFKKTVYKETSETKWIHGYACTKFTIDISNDVDTWEAWVNTSLPNTLIPVAGFKSLPGAILELSNASGSIQFTAQSIELGREE